ncbi:ankyrin repeat domain-containing protein [bacterium]|jgi:hypothetical protein|nr:ankyrin repeat domain-containing protein [bacterium]
MKHLLLTTIAAVVLVADDKIVSLGGVPIGGQRQLIDELQKNGGKPTEIIVERGSEKVALAITPRLIDEKVMIGVQFSAQGIEKIELSTPLHFAAMYGHREIAELLIKAGAERSDGDTPLDWATHPDNPNDTEATADLLRKHGGKTSEELK